MEKERPMFLYEKGKDPKQIINFFFLSNDLKLADIFERTIFFLSQQWTNFKVTCMYYVILPRYWLKGDTISPQFAGFFFNNRKVDFMHTTEPYLKQQCFKVCHITNNHLIGYIRWYILFDLIKQILRKKE